MQRVNPYNAGMYQDIQICVVSGSRGAVLKVAQSGHLTFLAAPIELCFIVNHQLDAPMAQEKTRFEEIHRST